LFNGLDPARIAFSVRNDSLRPLRAGDNFVIRTILSEDDVYDPSAGAGDMILREFDLDGGNGLGAGLLPNENISFDWIQQLPDNFDGDYYLLVDINSSSGRTTFPLENTPVITLQSKNNTRVSLLNPENNDNSEENFLTERPTASSDGRFVTYEQIDADGVQQIWYRDIVQNHPPVLVSRSLLSTENVFGGNRHSLRPQISADGSVIVFHSFANDLVPDDQNEHADVFLFRTINNQLMSLLEKKETDQVCTRKLMVMGQK
jgi:Tol biopolymer transport system component